MPGLQEFVEDMKRDDGYKIAVVSSNGNILGDVHREELGRKYLSDTEGQVQLTLRDGIPRVFDAKSAMGRESTKQVVYAIKTDDGKIAGVLLLDCSEIFNSAREVILTENAIITITVLITIICSILLGSFLSKKTTRQIRTLEKGVREIALGNLDFRITCDGKDELSVLCNAFNQMATDLKSSRHQLEEHLLEIQENETRFRLATLASHDMIWELDPKTMAVKWNGGLWTNFGYSEDEIELSNDFWKKLIHPEDIDRVLSIIETALMKEQESWAAEYRIKNRDGSYSEISDRAYVIYDDSGCPARLIGAATNITERKKAERALADSESSFRILFANNPHPMWVYDLQTYEFLEVNDSAVQSYGYSREEFLKMRITDIRPADEIPRLLQDLATARPRLQHSGEWRHMRKDGSVFHVEIHSHEIDFKGRKAALVVAEDITKSKEVEARLRASEIRFRSLIERSSDITSVIDTTGRILYMSPSVSRMGYSLEEIEGMTMFDILHPDDVNKALDAIRLALTEPDVPHAVDVRFKDKDGLWHDSESVVFNQLNVPEVYGLVVNSRDITERKKLEAQFLRAQRIESIGILAGGIAHDLNNILAPIMLSVDMLREEQPTLKSEGIINTIETSVRRGADLVRQVLSFARGADGEQTVTQLRHLVSEIEKILRETFPRSVDIVTDIPRNLWTVMGDPTQLHQIIMNLCVNSRDAMPNGGRLEITAGNVTLDEEYTRTHPKSKVGPHVVLTFADTGIGIPESNIAKIFEPFFTTKEKGKGTGLGLSTVSTIVKNHGGFVDVESEVGRGTTFKVYLPAQTTSQPVQESKASKEKYSGDGELILIVDDERAVREFIKVTLETYGYTTLAASDGTEAMGLFAKSEKRIDLVITDVMMPYMDGVATVVGLRKLDSKVRIVAVSGLTEGENAIELQRVESFLNKPFTAHMLLKTVHDALKKTLPAALTQT